MSPRRLPVTRPVIRPVTRIARLIGRVVADRRGGTAMEYGLILSLIVITMLAAFVQLANTTTGMWNNISANVTTATH